MPELSDEKLSEVSGGWSLELFCVANPLYRFHTDLVLYFNDQEKEQLKTNNCECKKFMLGGCNERNVVYSKKHRKCLNTAELSKLLGPPKTNNDRAIAAYNALVGQLNYEAKQGNAIEFLDT